MKCHQGPWPLLLSDVIKSLENVAPALWNPCIFCAARRKEKKVRPATMTLRAAFGFASNRSAHLLLSSFSFPLLQFRDHRDLEPPMQTSKWKTLLASRYASSSVVVRFDQDVVFSCGSADCRLCCKNLDMRCNKTSLLHASNSCVECGCPFEHLGSHRRMLHGIHRFDSGQN
jgi:hypothetical protein